MLDESCGNDVEDELAPELEDNPGTTTGTKFSVLHVELFSHSWSDVAFDRWPTHMNNRALRRVSQAIELQACPRVTALSRRDQDREHILVLPRSFAPLHWRSPPLLGFWTFEGFPVGLSLNPFCSACALMLQESTATGFFEEGAGITHASVGN